MKFFTNLDGADLPTASNLKKRDIKGGLSVDKDGKVINVKN